MSLASFSSLFVVAGVAVATAHASGDVPSSSPAPPAPSLSARSAPTAMAMGAPAGQTAISGNSASSWAIGADGIRGITGLSIGEEWDDPCYMRLEKKNDDDASDTTSPWTSAWCNSGANSVDLNVGFPNNPRYFVRGISVCLSNSGKIKGVAIVAAKLPVGSNDVEELVDFDSDQLPNCAQWEPWVYCPVNSFAQYVIAEVENSDYFTGISLKCNYRS